MAIVMEDLRQTRSATIGYGAGQLTDILLDFQRRQLTGVARVEALLGDGSSVSQRVIVLREGFVTYAGATVPTPFEFVTELAQHIHIGVLDTVQEFAAKRSSVQSVLRAMVEIRVLQWQDIAAVTRRQSLAVLRELQPVAGRIMFESGPSTFDLQGEAVVARSIVADLQLTAEPPSQERESVPPSNEQPQRSKPIILSVDDSPVAQALVKRALGNDYTTLCCGCVVDALNLLNSRNDISVLLLDLTLPDMDGLEFCRVLRGMERYKKLPIVMLTARDGMVDRVRGRFAGTTRYLSKPVSPVELAVVVAQQVAQHV
ncbi:MAG: response regulator [Cyanobacteria bacterium J06641_5]